MFEELHISAYFALISMIALGPTICGTASGNYNSDGGTISIMGHVYVPLQLGCILALISFRPCWWIIVDSSLMVTVTFIPSFHFNTIPITVHHTI